ncbi:DUF2530 domain-containing protein [Streptomyces sp. GDS52]|uniref:DUF2530 domain-containing protein n=1 Tax=Streptomyces cathayae TaxID=3031124 RepID=A0ABY8K3P1_9ACTN|nr:DUF2530 domain-containing protein [Streptomyces sp. HUAS 5]WGD42273.1 DUF2530 domain-containing protein [Streptomyces sp. HUAS 5]
MAAFFSGLSRWFTGTPKHEAPEPLEGPVVATIVGGTIIWFALFLVQLPFYGWFDDHGRTWWLWTCLAGGGLGFIGIWYVRRRDAAIKRDRAAATAAAARTAETAETEPAGGPSGTSSGAPSGMSSPSSAD